jgi:3'(2'), 5'-bisphosphate nucleotidase
MDLERAQLKASEIAKAAGKLILAYQKKRQCHKKLKPDRTWVTDADIAADVLISKELSENFPECTIISEESYLPDAQQCSSFIWCVDPLDGTQDFIDGTGSFSVSIALLHKGYPVLGVIFQPETNILYSALTNKGAFVSMNGLQQPIDFKPKPKSQGQTVRVVISPRENHLHYMNHLANRYQYNFLYLGSCTLKCCMVAMNEADCYIRCGLTSVWDTAAAQCILEEAGCQLLTLEGVRLSYDVPERVLNPHFVAINPKCLGWETLF